jgi:pentatricopeptide repeat protein
MARRPALVKRKPKAIRITKSEAYIVNKKHLGDEPIMTEDVHVTSCLNWYNYMSSVSEARDFLKDYYKNTGKPELAKKLSRISDNDLPLTAIWLCRMISRGYKPAGTTMEFIGSHLTKMWTKVKVEVESNPDKPVVSIQDRMREKAYEIGGEVEGFIDDNIDLPTPESFYDWLQKNEIPAAYITRIVERLTPRLAELFEAYDMTSGDLIEAYAYCKKKDFERMIKFFNMMIEDSERYASNTKKVRQTRKPRVVSVEKKIKNLKWQKEDATYKIASVSPEKIIGAQELWTFNTKYKTLTVFRALDRGGLQVKGTSIIGFDEATSFTKGTGRKPEEYVKRVLDGGKLVLRKIMDEIKTDKPLAYRINENTILLRVVN